MRLAIIYTYNCAAVTAFKVGHFWPVLDGRPKLGLFFGLIPDFIH
jgi:hypothetical protein